MGTILILVIVLIDQLVKRVIETNLIGNRIPVIENVFYLDYIQNTGGAWGILAKYNMLFIVFTPIILIGILLYLKRCKTVNNIEKIGLYFVIGGAIGNYIDRIFRGYVVDFLDFVIWPVFNIADISVVVGAMLVIISMFINPKKGGLRPPFG